MENRLAIFDRWLVEHRPVLARSLRPGASASALRALEMAIGARLPAELAALLRWHDGQDAGAEEGFQGHLRLLPATEIAAWVAGVGECAPDEGRDWGASWIPFLAAGNGDVVCLDSVDHTVIVRTAADVSAPDDYPDLATWLSVHVAAMIGEA